MSFLRNSRIDFNRGAYDTFAGAKKAKIRNDKPQFSLKQQKYQTCRPNWIFPLDFIDSNTSFFKDLFAVCPDCAIYFHVAVCMLITCSVVSDFIYITEATPNFSRVFISLNMFVFTFLLLEKMTVYFVQFRKLEQTITLNFAH